jgi:hypothetical protein
MAVDAFLKLGDLKGESPVKGYEDQIQVLSWSWGMSQTGTTHMGTGGGAGKVNVQDMAVTHYVDTASPNIIKACCPSQGRRRASRLSDNHSERHHRHFSFDWRLGGRRTKRRELHAQFWQVQVFLSAPGQQGRQSRRCDRLRGQYCHRRIQVKTSRVAIDSATGHAQRS